jgi:hypothetical protein
MVPLRSNALLCVLVSLVLVLVFGVPVEAGISSDCANLQVEGAPGTYDLSSLAKYPNPFVASDLFGQYSFRVCSNNVPCVPGKAAAGCQQAPDGTKHLVGLWDPSQMKAYYENGLVFVTAPLTTPGGSGTLRAARIHVMCDPGATSPRNISAVGLPPGSKDLYYDFFVYHASACPRPGPPGATPSPPKGSVIITGSRYPYDPLNPCSGPPVNVSYTLQPYVCTRLSGELQFFQLMVEPCGSPNELAVEWYSDPDGESCSNDLGTEYYQRGECIPDYLKSSSFVLTRCTIA